MSHFYELNNRKAAKNSQQCNFCFMYSYYICVCKCETKAQARTRVCMLCEGICVEQRRMEEGGGDTCKRQMVTQWSCSPTPSLFRTPFWVLHPLLVTSPKSYLICFFSSPLIISIFQSPTILHSLAISIS